MKRKLSFSSVEVKDEMTEPPDGLSRLPADAVSDESHTDRQWTKMMLHNLHFCASKSDKKGTSLEDEWRILYPYSTLTPRNLKSRFTVYERTRSGTPPPKYPMYSGNRKPKSQQHRSASKQPLEPVLISILPQKYRKTEDGDMTAVKGTAGGIPERYASQPPHLIASSSIQKSPIQEKENTLDSSLDNSLSVEKYICKEKPVEYPDLPRSKWICDHHYIHVFYDDENKSYECILTDQLLQIRHALVPHFPGQDLYKPGKKPPGFAQLLLHHWKLYYPGSEENNKTISMKIGKYDRAIQMLTQKPVTEKGKINWTPNMIEDIRLSRERALSRRSPGQDLNERWKEEWYALYPALDITTWKQVLSRYQYHFGAEIRDESDSRLDGSRQRLEQPRKRPKLELEEDNDSDDIKGLRQWNRSMQEDLLILKDLIFEEYPEIEPGSKEFAQKLLQAFQLRHPACLETARSLLARLKDPLTTPIKEEKSEFGSRPGETSQTGARSVQRRSAVTAGIEGFKDWNLSMLKDFIACMDKTRKKYAVLKVTDPNLKLVPLLLEEWLEIHPTSQETVKSFLTRIKYLKLNKEKIKQYLAQNHDLIKQEEDEMKEIKEEICDGPRQSEEEKFMWNSQTMMPDVISTRAKAVAIQAREARMGRKVSYARLWIKEFKKLYPNCPYTANNLSVHYFYWNSKESGRGICSDSRASSPSAHLQQPWTEDRLGKLFELGHSLYQTRHSSQSQFKTDLKNAWQKLYSDSYETGDELMALFYKIKAEKPLEAMFLRKKDGITWNPKLNQELRGIVCDLQANNEYTTTKLISRWREIHSERNEKLTYLLDRIEDNNLKLPTVMIVPKPTNTQEKEEIKVEVKMNQNSTITAPPYLNSRGQMRWSQDAISHLIACHKLAAQSKNSLYNMKLQDVLHAEFTKRYPLCPVGPSVLLTKCYIFRSEIKSGKLRLQDAPDLDNRLPGNYSGSLCGRSWTQEMLSELAPARQRALQRKRRIQMLTNQKVPLLGDLWLEEFKKKFPEFKSSKKTLMKKYKQCQMKHDRDLDIVPPVPTNIFLELKGLLENKEVILPPEIPASLFNVVEQWIFNHCVLENENSREQQKILEREKEAFNTDMHQAGDTCAVEEDSQEYLENQIKQMFDSKEEENGQFSNEKEKEVPVTSNEDLRFNQPTNQAPELNNSLGEMGHTNDSNSVDIKEDHTSKQEMSAKFEENVRGTDWSVQDIGEIKQGLHDVFQQQTVADDVHDSTCQVKNEFITDLSQPHLDNIEALSNKLQDGSSVFSEQQEPVTSNPLIDTGQEESKALLHKENSAASLKEEFQQYIKCEMNTTENLHTTSASEIKAMNALETIIDKKDSTSFLDAYDPLMSLTDNKKVESMETDITESAPTADPQPVHTTMADGSKVITITTVENASLSEMNVESLGSGSGLLTATDEDADMSMQVMGYFMSQTPQNLPKHLLEKVLSSGLQVDNLYLALRVYSMTRASFESLLHAGYLASWSKLLLEKWEEEGLPRLKFEEIEEIISIILDDSGLRLENRTVDRVADTLQSWDTDRINMVLKIGLEHRNELKSGYQKLINSGFDISMKEFVSILIILGILNRKLIPDNLDVELELIDTWDSMKLKSGEDSVDKQTSIRYQQLQPHKSSTLAQIGTWFRKTKSIPGVKNIPGVAPTIPVTSLLLLQMRTIRSRALNRWLRMPSYKRRENSIGSLLRRMTIKHGIDSKKAVGFVSKIGAKERLKLSRQETCQIERLNREYHENLRVSTEPEAEHVEDEDEENLDGEVEEIVVLDTDFTKEENVLNYLRKKENRKRACIKGWNVDNLYVLLKARDQALKAKQRQSNFRSDQYHVSRQPAVTSQLAGARQSVIQSSGVKLPSPLKQKSLTELLVDKWVALKPGQVNINPYNLILAINKFKDLQQRLILEQDSTIRLKVDEESEMDKSDLSSEDELNLSTSRSKASHGDVLRIPVLINTPINCNGRNLMKRPHLNNWLDSLIQPEVHHTHKHLSKSEESCTTENVDKEEEADTAMLETGVTQNTDSSTSQTHAKANSDSDESKEAPSLLTKSDTVGEMQVDSESRDEKVINEVENEMEGKDEVKNLEMAEEEENEIEDGEEMSDVYECPECFDEFQNVNNYQLHRTMHTSLTICGPVSATRDRLAWSGYVDTRGKPCYDFVYHLCSDIVDQLIDNLHSKSIDY